MADEQPMQPYQPRYVADPELWALARKRVKAKRELQVHLSAYLIVMLGLVLIWFVTNRGGYFWPIWPMIGWGIGLALHGASLRWDKPVTDDEISAEARRLQRRDGPRDTT